MAWSFSAMRDSYFLCNFFNLRLEIRFGILNGFVTVCNQSFKSIFSHISVLVNLGKLFFITKVPLRGRANWLEAVSKCLKLIIGTSTVVVFKVVRVTVLDGGESTHTVSITEGLAISGAVNIENA